MWYNDHTLYTNEGKYILKAKYKKGQHVLNYIAKYDSLQSEQSQKGLPISGEMSSWWTMVPRFFCLIIIPNIS